MERSHRQKKADYRNIIEGRSGVVTMIVEQNVFCPGCGRHQDKTVHIYFRHNRTTGDNRSWFYVCDNCLLDMYLKIGDILEVGTLSDSIPDSPKGFVPWYGGDEQIHKHLLYGQKIKAIKRWRELTGAGWKDSKDRIDQIVERMGSKFGSKSLNLRR